MHVLHVTPQKVKYMRSSSHTLKENYYDMIPV